MGEGYGLVLDLVLDQGLIADSRYMTQGEADSLLCLSTGDDCLTEESRLLRKQHLVIQFCRIRHEYGEEINSADALKVGGVNMNGPKLPYHLVTEEQKETVRSLRGMSTRGVQRRTGLSERTIEKIWRGEL